MPAPVVPKIDGAVNAPAYAPRTLGSKAYFFNKFLLKSTLALLIII